MKFLRSLWMQTTLACALIVYFSLLALAAGQVANAPARITQPIDEANLVTLRGNTHPLARPQFDQGVAPDSLPMDRMLLILQRSAEQEAALRKLLDGQQIKSSPDYHRWLTPEQFGQQFGPADADIQAVTGWLTSQGFQVGHVTAGRTIIEFSGTAGQVRQALRTEIHKYVVNGEEHWANASDPQIPAALAPVVAGFASLNNFPKRPRLRHLGTFSKSKATGRVKPLFTYPYEGGYLLAVGPTDFATIYNVTPLWNASTDGTGQTIAVSEQSDINLQDVKDFRTMFGLPVSANNVKVIYNGPDPGILASTGDEGEAALDVQWAGAVAKGATIDIVVSETTTTTAGVDLSALYIVDNNISPVMSESYGECEAFDGTSGNLFYNTLWEQGAAQGITIVIAAGDSGSAGCDDPNYEEAAQYGLAVGGDASTPFNIAMGGTDFSDSNWQQYWNITNGSGQSSALSYIPEMPWNDSCASTGSLTDCDTAVPGDPQGADLAAGSGGPSNCATSNVTTSGAIQCLAGIPKPAWQTGPGVPSDGVRDTPDLSLFAADGYVSGSFYIYCEMDANSAYGGSATSCDLSSPYLDFQGAGGTSFSTPSFAGIMAMVNQKTGERQGNANYVLYPLAAKSGASCASTAAAVGSNSCIFYDIQTGNNSVACYAGSPNCSNTGTSGYGIMVASDGTTPAWPSSSGYDLATGLGSVNAANLVNNWTSVSFAPTKTTLHLTPTSSMHGQAVNVSIAVSSSSGTPTGDVSLVALTGSSPSNNTGIGPFTLSSGAFSGSTIMLPGGSYTVTAHYAGDGTLGASDSTPPVQINVTPESSKTILQLATISPSGTVAYGAKSAVYGSSYFLRGDVINSSGNECFSSSSGSIVYACPTGTVTVADNGAPPPGLGAPAGTPGTYTLNSQGHFEDQFIQLPGGTNSLVATYAPSPAPPNNSYTSNQGTATITITQAPTTVAVTPSATTFPAGSSVTLTALVNTSSFGFAPSGTVQFWNGSTKIPGTVTYTPTNANVSATGYASLTATLTTLFTSDASVTAQYFGDQNYSTSPISAPVTLTVTGPGLTLSLTSLTFPPQVVGTKSTAQDVTLKNTGTATLNFTSIIASGDFTQTNTCASSLAAGASCTLSVTFEPTAPGTRTGVVTLTDDAANSPQTVSLTGTGTEPVVSLSSTALTFPAQQVGTSSSAQSATLKNTGTATLSIASITASGDFTQTNTCASNLAVGASCTLNVTFAPTAAGTRTGTLNITDNANPVTQTIRLTGTGTAPAVSLSAAMVTFGNQGDGTTSASHAVTLTNSGNAPLNFTSFPISGANASDFSTQSSSTCSTSMPVQPNANCTLSITFTPTTTGGETATITLKDNVPASAQTIPLSGSGVVAYSLSPTTGNSASVIKGTDSTTFTISAATTFAFVGSVALACTGQGSATCMFNPTSITPGHNSTLTVAGLSALSGNTLNFTVTGTSGSQSAALALTVLIADFSVSASPTNATLTAGQTATYTLSLTPLGGFNHQVSLTCTGAPSAAACSVSSASVTLDGTNAGKATVTVTTTARSLVNPTGRLLPPKALWPLALSCVLWLLMLTAFGSLGTMRRRRLRLSLAVLSLTMLLIGSWVACGGGAAPLPSGTPAGTYTLTLSGAYTGSSSSLSHSTQVGLTVN